MSKRKWAVIAIGGNSLIKDPQHKTVRDQYMAAKETCVYITDMIERGWDVAIGHGNGPQVGFILRRSEIAAKTAGIHRQSLHRLLRKHKLSARELEQEASEA